MIDVTRWTKKHPIVTWVVATYALVGTTWATAKGLYTAYEDVYAHYHPKVVDAVLVFGDFQNPTYDVLVVTFNNPTDKTQTVDNVRFRCARTPLNTEIFTVNDQPLPGDPNVETMPISLGTGESKKVWFLVRRSPTLALKTDCQSLTPVWSDAENKYRSGEAALLGGVTASFSNVVTNKN